MEACGKLWVVTRSDTKGIFGAFSSKVSAMAAIIEVYGIWIDDLSLPGDHYIVRQPGNLCGFDLCVIECVINEPLINP